MTYEQENNAAPSDHMLGENQNNQNNKKDKYYLTYIMFYFMGTTSMLNVNFYTTATDYWMYKFRDLNSNNVNNTDRTKLQSEFIADYSIVSNISNIIFFLVTITLMAKISMVRKIIGSLCGAVITFVITCAFVLINTDSWQFSFFIVSLIIGCLLTGFCAILNVTVFNMAASFPVKYVAAIPAGLSICGIFAALLQIFSLSIGASSTTTGFSYFLAGLFFVFQTLVGFVFILFRSDFFKYYLNKNGHQINKIKITRELLVRLLKKYKFYFVSLMIVLACTIMIHPGVTALVVSTEKGSGNKWHDVYFVPVITFLVYNVFDYIGRESAKFLNWPKNDFMIFIASCVRITFVPLIMLCNAQPRKHMPVIFDADYAYIIFIIIFGLTGGYLVNISIIQVHRDSKKEEKKVAMILILTFMYASLTIFSFLGAVFVKVL